MDRAGVAVDELDEVQLEGDWIRISEYVDSDGGMALTVTHSDTITPWKLLGMVQAAADFHRTMTTNIFFGNPTGVIEWEDEYDATDDEDEQILRDLLDGE